MRQISRPTFLPLCTVLLLVAQVSAEFIYIDLADNNNTVVISSPRAGYGLLDFNLTGDIAFVNPIDACSDVLNPDELFDKIVFADFGTCSPLSKARLVQRAGVKAIILRESYAVIPGSLWGATDGTNWDDILIPVTFMLAAEGAKVEEAYKNGNAVGFQLNVEISQWQIVYMSPATMAIWVSIDVAHLALIILATIVLVPHIRNYIKKRTDHGRIPIIILSVIIGSCILRIFVHLMSAYAFAYTMYLPVHSLNPHWTVSSLMFAVADSSVQIVFALLSLSWYSTVKAKAVPPPLAKLKVPLIIAAAVVAGVQIIGILLATLFWNSFMVGIFGILIMLFWLVLDIVYIIAATKLYKALKLNDKDRITSEKRARKSRQFATKVIALAVAFFLNFCGGLFQVIFGSDPVAFFQIVYPFITAGSVLISMYIATTMFLRMNKRRNSSSSDKTSRDNTSKDRSSKLRDTNSRPLSSKMEVEV
jgi:hypothetical protein